ncbi:unnamed protein product [Zymoseptoria tritici ST99CH_1A5]|nr:unnamed protein product [Zymoseptoria tritici ST99CH_1A5]
MDLEKANTLLCATPLTSATTPQAREKSAKLVALEKNEIMLTLWKKHHTNMQLAWPGPRRSAEIKRFLRRCRIDDKHNIPTTMATTSTLFDVRELRRSSDICITIAKADNHWRLDFSAAWNTRDPLLANTQHGSTPHTTEPRMATCSFEKKTGYR